MHLLIKNCLFISASLRGKVVWITGASSGIGKYLALLLAQHGVKLVLSARNVEELEKIKRDCIGRIYWKYKLQLL